MKDNGIERQLTVHDLPQQNGVAERLNRTLVEHARAMLLARNMPKFLWAEAIDYATWLKNRLPSRATPGHTPYELVNKSKPNLAAAHEFGCKVYVHSPEGGKLEARAKESIFVGVDEESKGFRIYWPEKRRISIERNVSFVPTIVQMGDVPDEGESSKMLADTSSSGVQHVTPTVQAPAAQSPKTPPHTTQALPAPRTPRPTRVRPPLGFYKALNEGERVSAAITELKEEDLNENQGTHHALAAAEPEPTLQQALSGPDAAEWQEAIDYEIGQLEKLGTWEIMDLPKGVNVIPCHFVLATKHGPNGEKIKLCARLVANGQKQEYGIDYKETFAPTSNMATIRTALTVAARQNWEIHQIDVKSAYLNATLRDDIYTHPPPGYSKEKDRGKVRKLLRSLVGSWLLGLKVERDRESRTIVLSQGAYIDTILEQFRLLDAKPASTPMETGAVLSPNQLQASAGTEFEIPENVSYQQAIGSLMYAETSTRPDISFTISILSQFMRNPAKSHWETAKRVIRYLKGTKELKRTLGICDTGLEAFVDADWGSQPHRHSISGYVVLLHGSPIAWSARKQSIIALSTAEAEYIALTSVAREELYLKSLLDELYQWRNQSKFTVIIKEQLR